MLRVVRCLPSAAGLGPLTDAQWAGGGQPVAGVDPLLPLRSRLVNDRCVRTDITRLSNPAVRMLDTAGLARMYSRPALDIRLSRPAVMKARSGPALSTWEVRKRRRCVKQLSTPLLLPSLLARRCGLPLAVPIAQVLCLSERKGLPLRKCCVFSVTMSEPFLIWGKDRCYEVPLLSFSSASHSAPGPHPDTSQ